MRYQRRDRDGRFRGFEFEHAFPRPARRGLERDVFALGRTEEAIAAAEHALTLNPANLTVRERLITALVKVGAGADRITLHQRYLEHYRKAAEQKAAPVGR